MCEGKRILIVSYCFAPQNVIGAVRATKLAKYLTRMGHEVTVLCGEGVTLLKDPTLARDLEELTDVHVVREWNPVRDYKTKKASSRTGEQAQAAPRPTRRGLKASVMNALYLFLLFLADRSFARRGLRELRRMGKTFDVAFTTYGPLSSHWIGRKAKRQGIAKRWIADFRDVVEPPLPWFKAWTQHEVRKVARHADQVTGVSHGYLVTMGLDGKGVVIPNGFDLEDLPSAEPEPRAQGGKLCFVYCGQMYGEQRDLRPFFRALGELVLEGAIGKDSLSLVHAGKEQDFAALCHQATAFGMEDVVKSRGLIPRDEAIRLQRSADAILIAAWNTPDCLGNLPGKLLEVLMMERPVICCTTGSVPDSEAARVVERTQTGFCYEEAEGKDAYPRLKAYVRGLCEAHSQGRSFPFAPNQEEIERYAYPHIAQAFASLFRGEPLDET